MLNLIINEYSKLFHKIGTIILIICIAAITIFIPVAVKLLGNMEVSFTLNMQEDISWNEIESNISSDDGMEAWVCTKAQEIGIDAKEYNNYSWRIEALQYIYNFSEDNQIDFEGVISKDDAKNLVDTFVSYVKSEDWEGYLTYKLATDKKYELESKYDLEVDEYVLNYRIKHNLGPDDDNDANNVISDLYSYYPNYLAYMDTAESCNDYNENEEYAVLKDLYLLDNNVTEYIENDTSGMSNYIYHSDFYNNLDNSFFALSIVLIALIVVAGNIFAKEFSSGTIKFLLINPVKRGKIFWAKFLTVISYGILLSALCFIIGMITSAILSGNLNLNVPYLVLKDHTITTMPGILFMLKQFAYTIIKILIATVLAFTISSLFRNSAIAIAVSLLFYFVGGTICSIAILFGLDFLRFTIFPCLDFNSILNENTGLFNYTMPFALGVLAVHLIILLLTAYDAFTKKNV